MKEYGLIGRPLSHSFSKKYFTEKFAKEGIRDCRYENYELDSIAGLLPLLQSHPALCGLNVTIPYKTAVISYLDEVSPLVGEIGACNCIHIRRGKLSGYNTDVPAFRASIEGWLEPHDKRALVLGSGGAAKAVKKALADLSIDYHVVTRDPGGTEFNYTELDKEVIQDHTIIVNTTPLGMYPDVDSCPPIDYGYLTDRHLLFDLVYNPTKTRFLLEGEKRGARIINGYEMLVRQAEESWRVWNS